MISGSFSCPNQEAGLPNQAVDSLKVTNFLRLAPQGDRVARTRHNRDAVVHGETPGHLSPPPDEVPERKKKAIFGLSMAGQRGGITLLRPWHRHKFGS